ncbi:MAG: glutamate racemase [Candidatus Omnitrophica bacterium]|nr:glutamate racemase [Candidatus Omnitrophota bacterium]MBU4149784.1 glutamate racemase [Candidatus Omnitrophota bacterium]
MDNRPIGIFDSGVGGLTVVKEVFKALPNEKIVYLGDTARVPYGTKSSETIKRFSIENADFLKRFKVKLIIVACNTASSISLPVLRKKLRIPVVGVIKPGARKAVETTKNSRVGVIGTFTTIKSRAYEKEISQISRHIKVKSIACPLFVPLAEEAWLSDVITRDIAKRYLKPFLNSRIDTLVLGCTHYPLLKNVISKVVGKKVTIIDSASSVAEEVAGILKENNMLSSSTNKPRHMFFATDAVEQFVKTGEKFLGRKIDKVRRADHV